VFDGHFHAFISEVELQLLLTKLKRDWVSLCCHQEIEWSIIDVISDGTTE
jgi:hypothetical protein